MSITTTTAHAAAAWWSPSGLQGTNLTAVVAHGSTIDVTTVSGATLHSGDSGAHFTAVAGNPPLSQNATVSAPPYQWTIDAQGLVVRRSGIDHPFMRDPGSPALGAGAHLLAAPGSLPGIVVAVATDGTVWRRGADGDWRRALLLLPQSLIQGVPRVTSIAAFAQPLSDAVYLGTDGYAVLDSTNGGDDWIRAGPGLPDSVSGLSADDGTHTIYAATPDGLWVHMLQRLPTPPAYQDAALVWRWIGIGLVTLVSVALTLLGLTWLLRASSPSPR